MKQDLLKEMETCLLYTSRIWTAYYYDFAHTDSIYEFAISSKTVQHWYNPVSYTHLDVYKRQIVYYLK